MEKDDVKRILYSLCIFCFLGGVYVSIREHVTPGLLIMALASLVALSVYSDE